MNLSKSGDIVVQTPRKMLREYYELGLWRCHDSPSRAHHWLINGSGIGQFIYCSDRRQFAESAAPDFGDDTEGIWGNRALSENWLRGLLPIT